MHAIRDLGTMTITAALLAWLVPGCGTVGWNPDEGDLDRLPTGQDDDDADDDAGDDDAGDDDDADDDDTADDDVADDDVADDDDTAGDDDTSGVNHPPGPPGVIIDPATPAPGDPLTCIITQPSTDPDGDPVTYEFYWAVDGTLGPHTTDTVPSGVTSNGEVWTCYVVPSDGIAPGATGSADVTVGGLDDPFAFYLDVRFDASGGAAGGSATVQYTHTMLDQNQSPLCSTSFEFDADYTYGTGQPDDFYASIDEVLTWTSGGEVANSCPPQWQTYAVDPVSEWMWMWHPMAFVSCDRVAQDPALAATVLGDDLVFGQYGPTFADHCDSIGPGLASALGAGAIEGIWLGPGVNGALNAMGTFGYFAPPDQTNVDVWLLMGYVTAAPTNFAEPVIGLQGSYWTIPLWMWLY